MTFNDWWPSSIDRPKNRLTEVVLGLFSFILLYSPTIPQIPIVLVPRNSISCKNHTLYVLNHSGFNPYTPHIILFITSIIYYLPTSSEVSPTGATGNTSKPLLGPSHHRLGLPRISI
ncbi:unnamed protein product [Kuraishia capsulata CBS 1993]|uniref:Uncharacterized protein n=1 Tax=Kuraishia capsulata CBS 1993 TaxID=1382522 RepID=W6MVX9_9ASCO|nr:uncharacterized protein KUCA_T00002618001 [Kuraishia capsulata CBS 1993]CDK26645.1 unnamed protein product [Kuraishia capsulata CBS 1993]